MLAAHTSDLHPRLTAAIVQNAELAAQLTARCLHGLNQRMKAEGVLPEAAELSLPRGFLLEIGAVGQLRVWEMQGLRPYLPADLPTFADATAELYRRAREEPAEFQTAAGAKLSPRVLQVWIESFCWEGPALLEANLLLGDVDEDALVDAVAHLLWNNRLPLCQ